MCADDEFHNGNNSVYFIGNYDRDMHKFDYNKVYALDDGIDFYAPQTTLMPDGRRVMIGWMQSWDSNIRPFKQKWSMYDDYSKGDKADRWKNYTKSCKRDKKILYGFY